VPYLRNVPRFFHVTSNKNRESIEQYGLDWTRMTAARGIAGSSAPEEAGIFVCFGEHEADFFVMGNNTGGPVVVWAIEGIDLSELVESDDGFSYLPRPIPPTQLRIHRADVAPGDLR